MTSKIYAAILLISFGFISKAQLNAQWANSIGSTVAEIGEAIAVDPSTGDVYVTGTFSSTVDFDPGPGVVNLTTIQNEDIFLAKYSSTGTIIWVKPVGGGVSQIVYDLKADASGVYMVGAFNGATDFDNNVATSPTIPMGIFDGFIEKFNTSGIMQWLVRIPSAIFDRGTAIAVDASQNVYVTGFIGATADMDPGAPVVNLTPTVFPSAFLAKYNSTGTFGFAKLINGLSEGNDIALNSSGEIYVTGSFSQTVDFDPSAATATLTSFSGAIGDIFLAKYDASGNYMFAEQIGGTGSDIGVQVETDASGNVYLAGNFNGTTDFDPSASNYTLTSTGGSDIFLSKYTSTGTLIWAENVGGSGNDNLTGLALDASVNIYITGSFAGTVDFDPSPTQFNLAGGATSAYLAEYNSNGVLVYAGYPGISNSEGRGLAVGTAIYLTGYFASTGDFDLSPSTTTLTSNGIVDVFFAKYSVCSGTLPVQPSAISCNSIMCIGASQIYSVTNDPAVSGYIWNSPTSWLGSSSTNTINLTTGTVGSVVYVAATNSCGIGPASSVAITVAGFSSAGTNATLPTCFSFSNGSATVSPIGGIQPFTYTWIPTNQSTSVAVNIAAGVHTVIAADAYGCIIQRTVNVTQPPLLTLNSPTLVNASCNSPSTGVMGATATGGSSFIPIPHYNYSWQTANSFTPAPWYWQNGIPAGSYTLVVTDTKSCTASMGFTITQPTNSLVVVSTATLAACNGSAVGSSTVIFAGGPLPYTYLWSPTSQNTNTLINAPPGGGYNISCTDADGCVKNQTIAIPWVQTPTVVVTPNTSSVCSGQPITLIASGATTYTWSTSAVSNSITDSPNSTTVYTVTGENNTCYNSKTNTVNVTPSPTVLITASANTICAGSSVTLTANSANSYTWNNSSSNATLIVVNPTSSTVYTLTGESNNCNDTAAFQLNVFALPTITLSTSDIILCVGQVATITANGANTYTWSDNSNSNPYVINPGSTTVYTITGTDTNGCSNTAVFTQIVSTCTNLKNVVESEAFEVYPNPFVNEITVKLNSEVDIEIFNAIGQSVYNARLKEGSQKIITENLSKGIYFIRFNDRQTIKLIKQ